MIFQLTNILLHKQYLLNPHSQTTHHHLTINEIRSNIPDDLKLIYVKCDYMKSIKKAP